MEVIFIFGIVILILIAYANGANDVSKTIATLVGGRVGNYKKASFVGACFNVIGSITSGFIAVAMIKTFSEGLFSASKVSEVFALSVILGAAGWVLMATWFGMPVSTTHSITGAIFTMSLYSFGVQGVSWDSLINKIALPLLFSPVVSLFLAVGILGVASHLSSHRQLMGDGGSRKVVSLNNFHWLSCAASSFARGANDAPKLVALGAIFLFSTGYIQDVNSTPIWVLMLVALAMGVGGVVGGLKVTRTLACRVTRISHLDGFIANLTTSVLVILGANTGVPMSTTQVSAAAILGIGIKKGTKAVMWGTVKDISLSWLVTLPVSGVLSLAAVIILSQLGVTASAS